MQVSAINILVALGLLLLGLTLRKILQGLRTPLGQIPGPWHTRYTNLRLKLAVITGKRIHYIHSLHGTYGRFVRISPSEVAVNDVRAFNQIHGVKGAFEKSSWYSSFATVPRLVLFTMPNAQDHGRRRRLFAREFSKSNIRQNWEGITRQKVELAVSRMQNEASDSGGIVNVLKWWMLMTNDVSSSLMFGECFHVLEAGETNEFMRNLTNIMKGGGIGAELPLVRSIGRLLPFQSTKAIFGSVDYLMGYAKLAVKNMKAGGSKNIFAGIQAESEKGETLDNLDVEAEALSMFVAGTDTTAVSLTYLVWAVLSRPNLHRQVVEEIATLPKGYQDADVEKLPLVNAVIEETLRLYGAAPGALPRVVPPGGVDMGGYYIPQDTTVTTHAYSTHRDPNLFPDPLKFEPARWLPAGVGEPSRYAVTIEAKRAFAAFGAGARSCVGINIAYTELRLGIAEFFGRCPGARLAPTTTEESMEMENFFLIAPKAHKCEIVIE